jgi:hypothetical protein
VLAVVFGLHQTCGKFALARVCDRPYHVEVAGGWSIRRSGSRLRIVSNNTYLYADALCREVVRVLIFVAISVVARGHVCIWVLVVDLVVCYLAHVCSLNRRFGDRWRWLVELFIA